jgi:hypothetical protein
MSDLVLRELGLDHVAGADVRGVIERPRITGCAFPFADACAV